MALGFFKNIFDKKVSLDQTEYVAEKISVAIVAFEDDCITNSGKVLSEYLKEIKELSICYFDKPINKKFLDLQSRNFFDFIDTGKSILKRTETEVLIWGYREQDRIRLSFQTADQYQDQGVPNFSLLNSLYLPLEYFQEKKLPQSMIDLIFAVILTVFKKEKNKYLLQQTVAQINECSPPKDLSLSCMPYILNLLALTYLNSVRFNLTKQDIKIVSSIFKNAVGYCGKNSRSLLEGLVYANLGQVYHLATETDCDDKYENCKFAIDFYTIAQTFFNRHTYPYDFANTAYRLSKLYFDYWKYTSDIQFLRNAVFQLRESQKVFTKIMFPKIWAETQKDLGLYLSMMAVFNRSYEIAKVAIENYKNYQMIYNMENFPLEWSKAHESIANIFYECGKIYNSEEYFEEAAKYYVESAQIYQEQNLSDSVKRVQKCISKTDNYLRGFIYN